MKTALFHKLFTTSRERTLRILILISMMLLSLVRVDAQPVWVATTPSVGAPGPATIPVNYGIDRAGTVYIIVLNYNNPSAQPPATVRSQAIAPTLPTIVFNAVLPVAGANINAILQVIAGSLAPSTYHTIYLVAADAANVLQAVSVRLNATTLPCPKIQLFNFFGNLGECVNLGAQGMFQVSPLGLLPTGILAGSQWTIDWGDGSPVWTYTSTADNDLPGIQLHNFSTTINCAYVGTWTVKNPCNEFYAVQGVFVVHGRDIPLDGDGLLQMQETTTGDVDIVYVCEGAEHNIVLRDISRWNCQNPIVPPPLLPGDYDNDKPRTIQYVYGETPAGAVMNTITGTVFIGGSNPADAGNGYVGPVQGPFAPPNPGTLTDVITIPATCQVGERFYVYLKDWNKCNPFVDQNLDYVSEGFIIEVIDAPPVPVVVSPQTYCFGSVPATISAGITVAGNTINWYSDAALTDLLFNGNPYTHGQTAVGSYTYYATQTSGVNGCEGPAAPLTLVINPIPNTPTVTRNNPDFCFDGVSSITLTANPNTPPAISSYQWYRNGSAVAGATSSTIVLNTVAHSGNYTVQTYGIAPSLCPGPLSAVTTVTIGNPATVNAGADQNICSSTATVALTGTRGGSATSSTWTTSGTGTFANASALNTTYTHSAADRTAGTVTLTLTTDDPAGPCPAAGDAMTVTISPAATVNAGADQTICAGDIVTVTGTIGGSATSSTWSTSGTGSFANVSALSTTYTPSAADISAGIITLTLTTNDPPTVCGAVNDPLTLTINPVATVSAGADQNVCSSVVTVSLTGTLGGSATSSTWTTSGTGTFANASALSTTYTPSAADKIAATVTLTLTTNDPAGPCPAAIDAMIVTISPAATVNAGPDQSICAMATATLAGSIGGGAANGTWSGGTGIYNPDANALNAIYTPSAAERTAGTVTLILTTDDPAGPCGAVSDNITITIGSSPTSATITGTDVCIGQPSLIRVTIVSGAPNYTLTIPEYAGSPVLNYISGTDINVGILTAGPHTYTLSSAQDACGNAVPGLPKTVTVTVNANNTVSAASSTPTLCVSTPLTAITHTTTGATGIGAAVGLPAGVTAAWAANTITISGTPTATGVFNYSIPLTGGCGAANATGTITVTANNTVSAASSTPTLCVSTPLTAITHTTTGATGIGAAIGLPAGVTAAWAANTITISGTPTASGVFNYSIPLTGGCGAANATGTITVTANKTVSAASSTPTLCISTPLTAITHTTTGATGIGAAVGLPAGVTAAWAANTITISGTPTASGVFNYSIPLTGGCGAANATGTITVTANKTVSAASSTPTLCISTPLTAITHTTTGATGIGAAVGLPAGVTAAWAANTITISGTPTASGVFNYSIPLTGGCGAANATGTITVTANKTVSAASSTPTLCISTPLTAITHTTTGATGIGAAVGLPAGVTAAWAANTITISGTPTASGVFNYSIPLTGGCGAVNATGTITVTTNNTVSAASSTPTLCISTPLTAITHTTTGATGIGAATGLPAGVTAAWAANTITISGTPTATGVFNYSIPLTGGCGAVNATGTITVTANNTVSAASSTPTLCISTPLTAITHTTTGATGIGAAVGLPAGVTAAWAANTITISGTPTASGVFNYSIPLTGGCGAANATGTITVTANKTVSAASSTPTLCISTPLTAITHTTTGATGIGAAVGLPAGVTAAWAANTITISGTPTASGVFNYSIPLTGGCGAANATGTITVTANKTVSAASSTPTLCISTPLTAITHTTTGATGIGAAVGLPAGVTAAWAANTITISGTPTASGVFNYSIPLTGGCGVANATGTITVTANNTVSAASSTPTLCVSTPLTAITHTTTGATGIGAATGLPAGVTAAWAANTITISGTPTASGVFNYSIPLTGGCGAVNATGTITVITNNTVSAASSTPTLCVSTPLTAITHTTTGATGIGAAVGLPAGVTAAWAANTITISGTPTATGVFNYSIPLTGGCGAVNATGTITVITNNTVSAASSTPTLCISTPLTAITHTTTGATGIGAATGLPAGVTAAWAANTITISGTPTASGVFNYSIPLTGGCGTANATGTITVITNNTVSAASATPGLCISTPLTAITHTTTGATGIGAAVGLPAGVTAAWAANTITISGTPTASGIFNYSIPLTGGCGTANATGTITVVSLPATPAITGQAVVCGTGAATYLYQIGNGSYFIAGNAYVWTVPAGATRVAGGGLADNFVLLSFSSTGAYTLQVTENTTVPVACYGIPQPYTINVYNNPVPDAGTPETICQGDATILGGTPNGIGPSASGGTGSYTYSWLPTYGLNNPAAEHPSANPAVTMTYQLMVTDVNSGCISTAPSSVLVTVNPAPTVIMPPLSQTKCTGDVAVFTATVSGNSYQWEISTDNGGTYSDIVDNATYDNVTSTSLTVNNIAMSMSGYMYRLRVIGLAPCAPVRTSAATLTVNNSPAVTLHPVDATVCEAGFATFTSTASDAFTYQWYVSADGGSTYNPVANGGNYFGATTTTLNVLNIPAGFNTYRYKMAATGLCNPVS